VTNILWVPATRRCRKPRPYCWFFSLLHLTVLHGYQFYDNSTCWTNTGLKVPSAKTISAAHVWKNRARFMGAGKVAREKESTRRKAAVKRVARVYISCRDTRCRSVNFKNCFQDFFMLFYSSSCLDLIQNGSSISKWLILRSISTRLMIHEFELSFDSAWIF